jgi:hypothetical protein
MIYSNCSVCSIEASNLVFVILFRSLMFSKELRKDWKPMYFVLKDSHLLMYDLVDHSDLITEPKAALYMGGNITVIKQHEETANPDDPNDNKAIRFYFSVVNNDKESESIALCASTAVERDR